MWVTFALIAGLLVLYALDWAPVEVTSVGVLAVLLVFFHLFPVTDAFGNDQLSVERLLSGFANPALITIMALLVVGQGMVRTGVLETAARIVLRVGKGRKFLIISVCLVSVLLVSAVLNNIPVVVIFIPILQSLAKRLGVSSSKVMMGLSFTAVLGGSVTLIGSSSNLLVSGALLQAGQSPLGFFEFTVPGLVLGAVGLVYVLLVVPRLLPDRASLAKRITEHTRKYFLAQIDITPSSGLAGAELVGSHIHKLPNMRVRVVLRRERVSLPPFHGFKLEPGDVVVVAGSREALAEVTARMPGLLHPSVSAMGGTPGNGSWKADERVLAEVMVAPASRLIGRHLTMASFQWRTRCAVLGIQRRSQMFRSRITDIAIEAGDVLLVEGAPENIEALRTEEDVLLMEWSTEELPMLRRGRVAGAIFLTIIALASSGALPIVAAAVLGALAIVATDVLNVRQAVRAIDTAIFTMIPATLALGAALQETGGSAVIAHALILMVGDAPVIVALSGLFLLATAMANVIGSNAVAVLFTPIAISLATELGAPVHVFAIAVVFAANAGLATPIGYQTNLLVMGPGHYRFIDFVRAGLPLIGALWVAFTLFMPIYYGL